MRYRIFPSIGIARLGEDPNFFLAPERPGDDPGELKPDGTLTPVTRFKDATRKKVRKQGARFHIFESDDGTNWRPANLPASATVTWTVTLVNKKSAVTRPAEPPIAPVRPQVLAANESMVIKGGAQNISGAGAASAPFIGPYATTAPNGTPFKVNVELGQLKTDGQGRLIVLGGKGFSSAPAGVPLGVFPNTYYRNPKWHDDVADGPVTAKIQLSPTSTPVMAEEGAWVVVGPPDYAPAINCPVTLFDVIRQVGISDFGLPMPGVPSFDIDIEPIIKRVRLLRWVHDDATWSDARLSSPKLRSRAPADKKLRTDVRDVILKVQKKFRGHTSSAGPSYQFRQFQLKILDAWVAGDFDETPAAPGPGLTDIGLTRAALESAAGQGFCPGIEAGIIVLDKTLYTSPFDFRINHSSVSAGDLTALMAQPWQADFLKCATEWWPTQRPDIAPQDDESTEPWIRGAEDHKLLVERSARLGFIVQKAASEVFVEVERDPTL
ncbi:MAG TPA: LodA/GoxA family CTQ-dependent oxidase [Blastocatellia bacterium]|nr:LodA/GoxA family CTQ-dependent oxidase [Blastocatellia bacterium]